MVQENILRKDGFIKQTLLSPLRTGRGFSVTHCPLGFSHFAMRSRKIQGWYVSLSGIYCGLQLSFKISCNVVDDMEILFRLAFLLPHVISRGHTIKCLRNEVIPVPHKWLHSGDLIVGGIVSQIVYEVHSLSFDTPPSSLDLFGVPQ